MHHLNRRTLLAAAASLSIARSATTRADPSIHYDVIVVGGGAPLASPAPYLRQ